MKVSRILFLIVSFMFVCIGTLHTWVHFTELIAPEYEEAISPIKHLSLGGKQAHIWLLWQGFSFMMGICVLTIGLLNLAYMMGQEALQSPPYLVYACMLMLLGFIIFSGFQYFEMTQVYGGILGISLLVVSAFKKRGSKVA